MFVKFECQAPLHERKAPPQKRKAPPIDDFLATFLVLQDSYLHQRNDVCYHFLF